MALSYRYKAQDANGKIISGVMKAQDELELHSKLKAENMLLVEAKADEKGKTSFRRLKYDRVGDFALNLSQLLSAGVTLVRALGIVSEDEAIKPSERKLYEEILKLVRTGIPLSDAMEEQGDAFPSLFINMIRSAETGGNLDATTANMAVYYTKEYRIQQKIKSSTTYPKILAVLIVAVVIVIMGFVLPQFESLFAQMESLPITTRILMALSNFVANRWYILILVGIFGFIAVKVLLSIPQVKLFVDKVEIHIPKIGRLRKVIYTARFARTLASMYSAGIPILNCIQIARTTIGNTYIEKQFDEVIADVKAGRPLSEALDKVDGFVKKLISSVSVGEETGSLDTMLISIADQMDYDSEIAVEQLVAMIEPMMIVFMAVVVGFIMIAVIQPIYGSYQSIAGQGY